MNSLKISLLIPTMNRPDSLEDTLYSYMNSKMIPDQIIIVDQSSERETIQKNKNILNSFSNKTETVFVHLDKPSLTMARNVAIGLAKNEIIICSDDDINVMDDTLSNIFDIMSTKDVALIAGQDIYSKKRGGRLFGYLIGTRSFKKRKIGHVTRSLLGRYPFVENGKEIETEWAMGYFFAIRKSILVASKVIWDEKLRGYAFNEDLDFSFRYCKYSHSIGLRCILTNKVLVYHKVSKEYRVESDKELLMYVSHRIYLCHKLGYGSMHSVKRTNRYMLLYFLLTKKNYAGMKKAIAIANEHITEILEGNFNNVY